MNRFLAQMFFCVHERLLGRRTFPILRELRRSERWPPQKLRDLQLQRLRALVSAAYEHTPYWREVMARGDFRPDDVRTLEDIRRFPLLTKPDIRRHKERMVWREEGPRVMLTRTSGSTNISLEFYTSSSREAHITAARMRGHSWVGCEPGDKEVYFWGAPVEIGAQDRLKHLRDILRNDMLSPSLLLMGDLVRRYVEKWKKWGANCLFGYVSSFTMLLRIARREGIDLRRLKDHGLRAIVTTAELLSDEDRRQIRQAFDVGVYDSYGLREGGLIGPDCREGNMHVNAEQVLVEVVDRESLQPTDGEGELVVTMLTSQCMPVIRYRTGDLVTLEAGACPCGRTLPLMKVTGGRLMEFIVTRSGKWVSAVAILYICKAIHGIRQLQARQERRGQVRLLLAVDEEFPPDGIEQVRRAMRARLDDDDEILVDIVDEIPLPESRKQRFVISRVAQQLLGEAPSPDEPSGGGS